MLRQSDGSTLIPPLTRFVIKLSTRASPKQPFMAATYFTSVQTPAVQHLKRHQTIMSVAAQSPEKLMYRKASSAKS